jgi:divalent metal cation (Fe/Co/Zn/Cd) transporter
MTAPPLTLSRLEFARRGKRLEYFTIAWNSLEGLIAVTAGISAGSISLVGFGIDSLIEVTSGGALLWRMRAESVPAQRERAERVTLRIVGTCFIALAVYVTYEAVETLIRKEAPGRSIVGIVLAAVSLVVMPILARAKRKVSAALASAAMAADARQTDFCTYLSAILLGGLLLNLLFGLWWADPLAALVMVPLIAYEGVEALRGKTCCASD